MPNQHATTTPTPDEPSASESRPATVAGALLIAVCVAVTGAAALGFLESAAVTFLGSRHFAPDGWPWDLIIAGFGKAAMTHLLLWAPILLAIAPLTVVRGAARAAASPEVRLTPIFILLAGSLLIPTDLLLIGRGTVVLIAGGCAAAALTSAGVYFLLRWVARRGGVAHIRRVLYLKTGVAGVLIVVGAAALSASPFYDAGSYRVPAPKRPAGKTARSSTPNVLWIVLDTLRADRLGCYGNENELTPFLDSLTGRALLFENTISSGIWTVPAHASMFTGLTTREHGADNPDHWLDDSRQTLAELLAEHGYATAGFCNNPWVAEMSNLARGFQTYLQLNNFRYLSRFSLEYLGDRWGLTPWLPWLDGDYGAAITNRLAARWLDRQADRAAPFFLFVNYMETHLPYRVPRCYRAGRMTAAQVHRSYDLRKSVHGEIGRVMNFRYNIEGPEFLAAPDREVLRRQYDAAVRYLDDRVAELLDIFEQRGLLRNTFVVITSDHGEYLDTHGMWSHCFLAYQDLIHVPLILVPPGGSDPKRVTTPTQLADVHATVVRRVLGVEPPRLGRDTRDLLALAEQGPQERILVSQYAGAVQTLLPRFARQRDPEVLRRAAAQVAAFDGRFKFLVSESGLQELYDLANDRGETNNLIDSAPNEARRLAAFLTEWRERVPLFEPQSKREPQELSAELLDTLRTLGYAGGGD